jgi:transcriptional regulator with XRE-family HTH domain
MTTANASGAGRGRQNLRRSRERRGWSQEDFAKELTKLGTDLGVAETDLGVDQNRVSKWEAGKAQPGHLYTALICRLLDLPPDKLDLPHLPPFMLNALPTTETLPVASEVGRVERFALLEDPYEVLRRQFIQHMLTVVTSGFVPFTALGPIAPNPDVRHRIDLDEFIHDCDASIQSCWRLMQGSDIAIVPTVLIRWLPTLDTLVAQQSSHRSQLAASATQAHILAGLVAVLQNQYDRSEWFCGQAVEYANLAGDPNMIAGALKHLATKYRDAGYPLLTLRTYERIASVADRVSPLLKSRTHLGLALAHAECGNLVEAERQLDSAQTTFPARPHDDPAFMYADCRASSLNHYGGLIHLIAGRPRQAWQTFSAALSDGAIPDIPERTVLELVNCQAEAALASRELDLACAHLETAAIGAQRMGSRKRIEESLSIYSRLRSQWPNDVRILRIESLFAAHR